MTTRDLAALPKAHLHLHLEAGMRPSTFAELAAAIGRDARIPASFTSFADFNDVYFTLFAVLKDPANLARLIDEIAEDGAADGAVYLELASDPLFHAETFGGPDQALDAILGFAATSAAKHGIEIGVQIVVDRTMGHERSLESARLAVSGAGRGVVSIGLANEERGFPAADFAEPFAAAKAAGLLAAPHAGELEGPDSIWASLRTLNADRIQHGVRAVEDPALVEHLAQTGTCLDVCPTSNILLDVAPSLAEHPLPALLAAGVRCSINADDPILFGVGLLDEYVNSREGIGLTDQQLANCAWSSIECSGASQTLKATARTGIDAWLAR